MVKQWIKYAPEGRNTEYDVKMNLRNGLNSYGLIRSFPSPINIIKKQDYNDDVYSLNVNGEFVEVVAREEGQRSIRDDVLPQEQKGTFFFAEPKQKQNIEKILAEECFL